MAETVTNPGMDRYNRYYNSVLAQLQQDAGPERSDSQLKNYLQRIIRPTYDQAIAQRQQQTGQANAAIDTDAGSRGMGTSTWVTDAKMRQRNQEVQDIAGLNSNYASTLYDALLNQLNQRDQYRLSLMNQAQGIAGSMYDRWKAEEPVTGGSGGGGGVDDGGGTTRRNPTGPTDPGYGTGNGKTAWKTGTDQYGQDTVNAHIAAMTANPVVDTATGQGYRTAYDKAATAAAKQAAAAKNERYQTERSAGATAANKNTYATYTKPATGLQLKKERATR